LILPSLLGAADSIRARPHAVGGYACTFNQVFRRGGVPTVVKPGAFARAIATAHWQLLVNHGAPSQASTGEGTLHVEQEEYGLWFEASLPDDAAGAQLMERVRRREISGVSTASTHSTVMTVDGIDVWDDMDAWEISLMLPPARAALRGTFALPNIAARRHRLRVRGL
jgi:HK97 family phage prohead protease